MKSPVACDAMILIWGLKKPHYKAAGRAIPPETIAFQRRAWMLLHDLDDDGRRIIVPTIAVAEIMYGLDPKNHSDFLEEMNKQFFCPEFDSRASILAAQLWQRHRGRPNVERMQRSVLSTDVLIVSCAKLAGASTYYSHDESARSLAEDAGMKALDLPEHSQDLLRNYVEDPSEEDTD